MHPKIDFDTWMSELALVWVDRFGRPMPALDSDSIWEVYHKLGYSPDVALIRWLDSREVVA